MRTKIVARNPALGIEFGVWDAGNCVKCGAKRMKSKRAADEIRPLLEQCTSWEAVVDKLHECGYEVIPVVCFRRLVQ